ncbi:MAG: copper amine oxidase N-terminal domain-containing protein [Clostridiales Family XIII bacterium]|jgi:hypothetical protein|nr:copper amine oxidase N-terminal domain-containing protein [Clostridiales Family XIII bacterium]
MNGRKTISLLSLMLLLAFALLPAQVFATNYYEEWGDYEDWTDEQWDLSEDWTDAEWDAYDASYDAAWEAQWIDDTKQELSFPDPDGINITVYDAFVDFADAAPVLKDGVLAAPALPMLTALGAAPVFDPSAGTVTAVLDGVTLTFSLADSQLALKQGTRIRYLELPLTPYMDGSVVFAPVRALAEALGYDVFYSKTYRMAQIFNTSKMETEINSRFTLFNRLLDDSAQMQEGTWRSEDEIVAELTLYGDKNDDSARLTAKGTTLAQTESRRLNLNWHVSLDLADLEDLITPALDEDELALLKQLKSMDVEVISDEEEGIFYAKSPFFSLLADDYDDSLRVSKDDWLAFEGVVPLLPAATLSGLRSSGELSVGHWLTGDYPWWLEDSDYRYGLYYAETMAQADVYAAAFGDEAFRKSGNSYTARVSTAKLAEIGALIMGTDNMFAYAYEPYYAIDLPQTDLLYEEIFAIEEDEDTDCVITLSERNGMLTEFSAAAAGSMDQIGLPFTYKIAFQGGQTGISYSFEIVGRYIGKMSLNGKSVSTKTYEAVQARPPEDANIVYPWDYYPDINYEYDEYAF